MTSTSVCQVNRLHHLVQMAMLAHTRVGGKCHVLVVVCSVGLDPCIKDVEAVL